MKITFLGTGTSQGVPVITCECKVCRSIDKKDKRLRTSVLIETTDTTFVIDTGPDFRQQMLTAGCKKLDAVIFTHEHKDHTAGLDDVRPFNHKQKKDMDVYGSKHVYKSLKKEYSYIFQSLNYPGIPKIQFHLIANKTFNIGSTSIQPIKVLHYKLPVLGFKINNFVYITDANFISAKEKEKIKNADVLVLNALRKEEHISHFTLSQALAIIDELKPKHAYLTHISHQLGLHESVEEELPEHIHLAYDGLTLNI